MPDETELTDPTAIGADRIIKLAVQTSKGNPALAIAQLITAAVAVAKIQKMSDSELRNCVEAAISQCR